MKKILLVEDNEINRDMLKRRLLRKGYEIVEAVNGQEAIDKTRSEMPAIILMDMSLPIMDGWEATSRLKGDASTRMIPVIGLTAHAMVEDRQKAMEAGCNEYATKPVKFDELIATIERLTETPPTAA